MNLLYNVQCEQTAFEAVCSFFSSFEGTTIFYTGMPKEKDSSYLFLFPTKVITLQNSDTLLSSSKENSIQIHKNPFLHLEDEMGTFTQATLGLNDLDSNNQPQDFIEWVGFLSYEMGGYSDLDKQFDQHKSLLPLCYFQNSAITIKFSHQENSCSFYLDPKAEEFLTSEEIKWYKALQEKSALLALFTKYEKPFKTRFQTSLLKIESKEEYLKKIEIIQNEIKEGNVYQVNLSHELLLKIDAKPYEIFLSMAQNHPTPFAAFFNLKEYQIISLSPERFLKKTGDRLLTMPIKGTIERGEGKIQDLKNFQALKNSEKDKAELLMITDLLRNDLSKVSKVGSVHVQNLLDIEGFSNVWHLHSKIESTCLENQTPISIIRALFPGGSITGCPKLASQKVIQSLEDRPRGIYTGSIGYFTNRGDFDFNIAIRTLLYHDNYQSLALGGAIVIDSEKEKEYVETLHKGASFFNTLGISWKDIF